MSARKKKLKAPVAELQPDHSKLQTDIDSAAQIAAAGWREIAAALGTGPAGPIDLEAATVIASAQDALLSHVPSPDVLRGAFQLPRVPDMRLNLTNPPPEVYIAALHQTNRPYAKQQPTRRYRDRRHKECVQLLEQVLQKRQHPGESKTVTLESWLGMNKGLSRTQLTDYIGGRIKGHISSEKRKAIEAAIIASAQDLGLRGSE